MSPFLACLGYQPPLFEFQEDEVAVPAALQEGVEADKRCPSALLATFTETGEPPQGASTILQRGAEGLAVHEGSATPGRGEEAGAAICGSL